MFRKEIKVLDCTIRDGGLINNYQFSDDFVKAVYRAICEAGVDFIELGKKLSESAEYSRSKFGPWNFCDDDILKRIVDSHDCKVRPAIAVMFDVGRVDISSLKDKKDSPVDMIRTACYVPQIDKGLDLVKRSKDKGYRTSLNIMAVSAAIESELIEALEEVAKVPEVDYLYLVDSYGAFYSEQVSYYLNLYSKYVPKEKLGFHGHNNIQLGYSNTQQAIIDGVNLLDATINGIGRGAGNCCLELLLGFLKNPKFDVRPIFKVIQKEFVPLRKQIEWGYNDIYGISGILNQHPREAMKFRATPETRDNCYDFYEYVTRQDIVAAE
ncbi:MAG TPA: aldolase catalytic domain-containing protein [Elusimicrobiota bacterium]|nr:aldolase catalytic domain-containing protein [Elusimicrobiota bacterium]